MLRVLVTDVSYRQAVPIIRALGKSSMKVVCADSSRLAMGFFSKYCSDKFIHPEIKNTGFWEAFISWLREHPCDVLLPLHDNTLLELSARRDELPLVESLLLPAHDRLAFASNKSKLVPFADKLGIPVPKTLVISSKKDIPELSTLMFPLILKPAVGAGSRGVTQVSNPETFYVACMRLLDKGEDILMQEAIPQEGRGMGYCALFDRSNNIVAEFMHQRLREYPLSGGPSTLRESIWRDDLAEMSRKLLRALDWVGLAMVEYKLDPRDGIPKLMEVNARFWGSVALPIFCGVDFPVLAARTAIGLPVELQPKYPLGRKARWLWPGDILHLCESLMKGKWPQGFLAKYDSETCDDLLSRDDPLPNLILTLNILRKVLSPQAWKYVISRR